MVTVAIAGTNMTLEGLKPGSVSVKVNASLFSHTASSIMVIVSQRCRSFGGGSNVGRFMSNATTEM